MGWANCGEDDKGRPIGYAHEATCDHPGCDAKIDRGLGYACGGDHGGGDWMCDMYFCGAHMSFVQAPEGLINGGLCDSCTKTFEVQFPHCETCGGWGHISRQEPVFGEPGEMIDVDVVNYPCIDCGEHGIYKSEIDWSSSEVTSDDVAHLVVYKKHPDIEDSVCPYCHAEEGQNCALEGGALLDDNKIHIERTAS